MKSSQTRFKRHFAQSVKFAVCGVLGALLEFLILFLLVGRLKISPVFAYVFSSGIPGIFVFLFNRHVTFRVASGDSKQQSKRFILVYSLTFVFNYCLSLSLYFLGVRFILPLSFASSYGVTPLEITYAAKILAIGVTAILNYTFSHLFIFKKEPVPIEAQLAVF